MFAICVGNEPKHIEVYRNKFRVPFPIFPDRKMDIYKALGRPGTPFMILTETNGKVLMTHKGAVENLDEILAEIREAHK